MISWDFQAKNEPLVKADRELGELKEGWSRVKVAGCGLCHTDLGFIYTGVPTRHELPLTLGHEISGTIESGPGAGKQVLIPSVIPCGECPPCKAGSTRICSKQLMPGNDIHGGFAEYIDVPGDSVFPISKQLSPEELSRMSVISDAVTTPLQAIHNLDLKEGQVSIWIGCGGVGGFGAMLSGAFGSHVIAMDIDDRKLNKLAAAGIEHTLNIKGMDFKAIKGWLKETCKAGGYPMFNQKIFECSGTQPGQELGFGLLGPGAQLGIVGFTLAKLEVRLSNLMAFDARLIGNWGADSAIYPEAIGMVLDGSLDLAPFTGLYPLSEINDVIAKAHGEGLEHRAVLVP